MCVKILAFKIMYRQVNTFNRGNQLSFFYNYNFLYSTTDLTIKMCLGLANYRIRLQSSYVSSCMVILVVLIDSWFHEKIAIFSSLHNLTLNAFVRSITFITVSYLYLHVLVCINQLVWSINAFSFFFWFSGVRK